MLELHSTANGRFRVDIDNGDSSWQESIIYRRGYWDEYLHPIIEKYKDLDGVAIDIGANVGFITTSLARNFKHVYAIEPQDWVYWLLCATCALNFLYNVTPVHAAAYDREGIALSALNSVGYTEIEVDESGHPDYSANGQFSSWVYSESKDAANEKTSIKTIKIDDLIPIDEKVSFIKCDAQGSDLKALRGCYEIIKKWKPIIVFEYEDISETIHGDSLESYFEYFAEFGYYCSTFVGVDSAGKETILNYLLRPIEE